MADIPITVTLSHDDWQLIIYAADAGLPALGSPEGYEANQKAIDRLSEAVVHGGDDG